MNYYPLELNFFFVSILLLVFIIRTRLKSTQREAPELGGAWPIIGHLHLFGGDQLLHRTLGTIAEKYGPAFNIRLGTRRRAFVVSSWEVAKECLTVNDEALACRPKTAALKHMCYDNKVFGLGPYTPYWREMKKISIEEFLSNRRIEKLKDVRLLEINSGLNELYKRWIQNSHRPVVVELSNWLEQKLYNIIAIMVSGKRYFGDGVSGDEAARFQKAISEFFRLSGVFVVSDVIPFLWWLDLHGYQEQMKKTAKDLDLVLGRWLNEHRQKRKLDLERNKNKNKDDAKDFIDVMLSLDDEGKLPNNEIDSDTIIKSTCLGMILGGNTTAGIVNWAIALLLNHPDVLMKLQQEIDENVGKERQVDESDIKHLLFLEAIIKETFRLYPAGPLLAPREARKDCVVAGYDVKAGTRIIVNVWKIQRDERVWSDPSKFQPERFMGLGHKHIDLRGQRFVLLPFGFGRRSCPGVTLALLEIHLTLARLVHSFDLSRPGGLPVDMTEGPGMTNPKKKSLEVLLTPRLPSWIYG
ncbi:xanthotoxin 5-hydroxylase CYP82C4-like [Bidens hawaiensis]|uniref:xanthotoxin 5-hydroxylase CYP82C4-like n=1 Tax=Bidens hawaiensis TaxID=980011 RepID=UPI00404B565A